MGDRDQRKRKSGEYWLKESDDTGKYTRNRKDRHTPCQVIEVSCIDARVR
jgi:hypothetical protein